MDGRGNVTGLPFRAFRAASRSRLAMAIFSRQSGSCFMGREMGSSESSTITGIILSVNNLYPIHPLTSYILNAWPHKRNPCPSLKAMADNTALLTRRILAGRDWGYRPILLGGAAVAGCGFAVVPDRPLDG